MSPRIDRALVVAMALASACGSDECPDFGATGISFGESDNVGGWHPLAAGDDLALVLGPDGQHTYQLSLRVHGVDTAQTERGLSLIDAVARLDGLDVAGFYWSAQLAPGAEEPPRLYDLPVKTDVDDIDRLFDSEVELSARVEDGCGRVATGRIVVRTKRL